MVEHPDETLELLGGLAMMAAGGAVEGGGVALDATGVGAVIGVPANAAGIALMGAGATAAAAGGGQLGVHAMTDDRETPFRTDHASEADKARRAKEPNEDHPGRSKDGTYRSQNNDEARVDARPERSPGHQAGREAARHGDRHTPKVKAKVDGVPNGRIYDGLAEKPDGTYVGVEIKSGTATATQSSVRSTNAVSPENPATATTERQDHQDQRVIEQKVP